MQKPLVVITGATGYIGAHVTKLFVQDGGYRVKATMRDTGKLARLRAVVGEGVEAAAMDLMNAESIDAALAGATYVVHVASPCYFDAKTVDELVQPAVEGTVSVLKAAVRHGVKRVVITSSRAAISFGHQEPFPKVFSEDVWSDAEGLRRQGLKGAYALSKTLAERAAWEYVRGLPAGTLELVTIQPCVVVGPPLLNHGMGSAFLSGDLIRDVMHGKATNPFFDLTQMHPFKSKIGLVDVRSVAQAHINAVQLPQAANNRFMVMNGNYNMSEFLLPLHAAFAAKGWPVARPLPLGPTNATNPNRTVDQPFNPLKSVDVLKVDYHPVIGDIVVAMAEEMIRNGSLEKPAGAKL